MRRLIWLTMLAGLLVCGCGSAGNTGETPVLRAAPESYPVILVRDGAGNVTAEVIDNGVSFGK